MAEALKSSKDVYRKPDLNVEIERVIKFDKTRRTNYIPLEYFQ